MFNKLKTRKGRLEDSIRIELAKDDPKIENIVSAVESYQKDNIDTIEKLKKKKRVDLNKINGALKQTINAHGPITKLLIGSASKRIYGAIIENPNEMEERKRFSLRDILIGMVISTVIDAILFYIIYM